MRAYLNLLLISIFAAFPLIAQVPQASSVAPKTPYVENEERQFNFYPGGKIKIASAAPGNIVIIGWQKGSVHIEAEKILYNASPEDAKNAFAGNSIRVRWTQTSAAIATTAIPGAKMEINLKIYVPREKTDLSVEMNRGDFSIDSVNGWIEMTTQEGSIEAKSLGGYFSGITLHGNVNIELEGKRWNGYEFGALTHSGSIDLKLPQDFSAAIQFETKNGKISVDYPPQVVEGEPMPPDIIIRKDAQSLKASIGDGGAPIKLSSYSGNITLRK
jgi:DUF4097 and DUF4098 domain-containing protein YvlB